MKHTLVTFLGRARQDPNKGYVKATYRFPDGQCRTGSFFGLELARYLRPDLVVMLGTKSSQWDLLVEDIAGGSQEETEARVQLLEAAPRGGVTEELLGKVSGLISQAAGTEVKAKLIPLAQTLEEQIQILGTIAESVPQREVSIDVTHGFRHLGMIGFLSAFMLERVQGIAVKGLWYGALDMTRENITPVLRLDGLGEVRRWIEALAQFDTTGDYGVFSKLLAADGIPEDKARCLREAAFLERCFNIPAAAQKLSTFMQVLSREWRGASALFKDQLAERLNWVNHKDLWKQQRELAYQYLKRRDFVRAAILAWEGLVSRECQRSGLDPKNYVDCRRPVQERLQDGIFGDPDAEPVPEQVKTLYRLRNALAHGDQPLDDRYARLLREEGRLEEALHSCLKELLKDQETKTLRTLARYEMVD